MEFIDYDNIKTVLRNKKIWPNKMLGQNFLINEKIIEKIMQAADVSKNDVILEIGPGLGALTIELAKKAKLVLAVEKDRKLVEYLREKFKHVDNVKIICDDILQFQGLTSEQLTDYKIISNVPYNITSPILNKFITSEYPPRKMVLMIQKEVADRLVAKAGNSQRGFMTVLVEYFADVRLEINVPKIDFYPVPDVDSAVISIAQKDHIKNKIDDKQFLKFVKLGFSQKRRQIHHPLASGLHINKNQVIDILNKAKILPESRAEELSLNDWINLYKIVQKSIFH